MSPLTGLYALRLHKAELRAVYILARLGADELLPEVLPRAVDVELGSIEEFGLVHDDDRRLERERGRLRARVDVGVDRIDRRLLHRASDHDVAMTAHQRDRRIAERPGE